MSVLQLAYFIPNTTQWILMKFGMGPAAEHSSLDHVNIKIL